MTQRAPLGECTTSLLAKTLSFVCELLLLRNSVINLASSHVSAFVRPHVMSSSFFKSAVRG